MGGQDELAAAIREQNQIGSTGHHPTPRERLWMEIDECERVIAREYEKRRRLLAELRAMEGI